MDVTKLDQTELHRWLLAALDHRALGAGRIRPPFMITRGRLSGGSGWQQVGTAESPILTIGSLEAKACNNLKEFLDRQPTATTVADQLDKLLLADADMRDSGTATSVDTAFGALKTVATSILVPDWPIYDVPEPPHASSALEVFRTSALATNEIVFIHPSPTVTYLVVPISDIVPNGPHATLHLKAALAKPVNQAPLPVTRFFIS